MTSKMRLTIVVGSLNRGGCEMHLLQVLPRLQSSGFEVEVFTLSELGELAPKLEKRGVKVLSPWVVSTGNSRGIIFRLFRLSVVSIQLWLTLLTRRPDIVHFFLPSAYYVGGLVSCFSGVKRRVMSRRSLNNYQVQYLFARRYEQFLHQRMSALLGNSKRVVEQLVSLEGVSSDKAHLIYNGIDFKRFKSIRSDIRSELSIVNNCIVIAVVANLIPYKGHADLLEACKLLPKDFSWCVLLIGRDDGIGVDLKSLVERYGIKENIRFLGSRDDVPDILSASDLSVLPSHEEGFSNAIIEAMVAGLPVIATDVGGNAEAICDGETGFIVPAKSPNKLAQMMLKLMLDEGLRRKMGSCAKVRASREFSIETCVDAYKRLYLSLMVSC